MNGPKIAIVDCNLGNLFSINHAFEHLGQNAKVTSEKNDIENADALVLPGVGAFGRAMQNMQKMDLISPLRDFYESGKPILGICLGMQLFFTESEEFGSHKGLGFIKGSVKRFTPGPKITVPNIGWHKLQRGAGLSWNNTPLKHLTDQDYVFFVHSFYVRPEFQNEVLSVTSYAGVEYCSTVLKGNIIAFQFHPEKSGPKGIQILKNWCDDLTKK